MMRYGPDGRNQIHSRRGPFGTRTSLTTQRRPTPTTGSVQIGPPSTIIVSHARAACSAASEQGERACGGAARYQARTTQP